jgi:hypothetical protein
MKIEALNTDDFFTNSGKWEELLRITDKKIVSLAKNLDRQIYDEKSITLLGYGGLSYKKNKTWPVISIAPQKNFIAIYIFGYIGEEYLLDHLKHGLDYCTTGKGCIRFTKKEFLEQNKFDEIIIKAVKYYHDNITI